MNEREAKMLVHHLEIISAGLVSAGGADLLIFKTNIICAALPIGLLLLGIAEYARIELRKH